MQRHHIPQSSERGAVAAEFAIILPALLLLIFGMLQLGLAFQRQEAVHAAAREGARVASLPTSSAADACNRSTASLAGTSFTGTPTCNVVGDCATNSPKVVVTITVANTLEIPFFGTQTFDLTGKGDFRCE